MKQILLLLATLIGGAILGTLVYKAQYPTPPPGQWVPFDNRAGFLITGSTADPLKGHFMVRYQGHWRIVSALPDPPVAVHPQ